MHAVKFREIFRFREIRGICETKFREIEISRTLVHFRMIFAFSRKFKNKFSFQP
jgi:hypothetical protein